MGPEVLKSEHTVPPKVLAHCFCHSLLPWLYRGMMMCEQKPWERKALDETGQTWGGRKGGSREERKDESGGLFPPLGQRPLGTSPQQPWWTVL